MISTAVSFQEMLSRAVRLCGLDINNLSAALAADFASWLEARVRDAWILARWPGTLALERRAFAPFFVLATSYAAGEVVYDDASSTYYTAAQATVNQPVSNATYWTKATTYERALALEQKGQTAMAEILGLWRNDPRRVRNACPLAFTLLGDAAWCEPCGPATVYVLFRQVPPLFTATPYNSQTTYFPGDTCFTYPHSYRAIIQHVNHTPPNPLYWTVQQAPAALADYAARGAKADFLASDGQEDKAANQETFARAWLNDRLADLTIHQHQSASYLVS